MLKNQVRYDPPGVGGAIHVDSDLEQENRRTSKGGFIKMNDRQQAYEDMATPDTALNNLVKAESELYLQGDGYYTGTDRRADERPADHHDNAMSPDEALEHMKQMEANVYMREV